MPKIPLDQLLGPPRGSQEKIPLEQLLGAPKPPSFMDKVSHLIGADGSLGGQISDFLGGAENPIINAVNLVPEAERSIVNAVGAPNLAVPNIPNIPTSGGVSTMLGNIVGTAIPMTGAAKLVEGAEALPSLLSGAEKSIPSMSRTANTMRGALTGAFGGAASNHEGNRERGAAYGALGGAAGGLVSPASKSIEDSMPNLSDIHENVADKYINLHNQANNLYRGTNAAAEDFDTNFPSGITTPEYTAKAQEILDTLNNEKGAPSALHPDLLKTVKSITERPQDTVSGLLNERLKLNNILRKIDLDTGSKSKISELKDAAQSDLANLPNNVSSSVNSKASQSLSELQNPYMQANRLWAEMKNLAGRNTTKRQRDLLENMVGANDYDEAGNIIGNNPDRSAFDKLYLAKPSTSTAAKSYDNLVNASGLDKDAVAHAIKNEPFKNETDPKAFHKFYKSLSKDQNAKKWLFSPNEQDVLDKAVTKKPAKLTAPIFIAAEALAHHLGHPLLGASFPAYLAAKAGSRGINRLLSREITPQTLERNGNNIFNRGASDSGLDLVQRRGRVIPAAMLGATLGGSPNGN